MGLASRLVLRFTNSIDCDGTSMQGDIRYRKSPGDDSE
jgi:hypothetical protein